ncbi:MAG: DNA topoisomerase VI [Bdellovibrionales bacterium]|nr:DNA topoisomerase VI [Bdellovibrionales bacterium]
MPAKKVKKTVSQTTKKNVARLHKRVRAGQKTIPDRVEERCWSALKDLQKKKSPVFQAVKCSLDNSHYDFNTGYLVPRGKKVSSELNVSSVQKISRSVFMMEILLNNIRSGAVNTKRELYYIAKGMIKGDSFYSPLDFDSQNDSDAVIDFICDMFEVYREEMNCFANDRGGQTYSKHLIVTETLDDGSQAEVDLSALGTTPFQPKNKPQQFQLRAKGKVDYCIVIESEGTANTLVANGMTKRHNCIIMGAQGVPSNAVRGWCKTIQDQLKVPIYFYGDLDAYTLQNIYRTLKAGSAASLIRNADFSAPKVRFLGLLPEDVTNHSLDCYEVSDKDPVELRSLKKAKDALANDPFFKDKKNKLLAGILKWLIKEKRRCEQQSVFSTNPKNPRVLEEFIVKKIKSGSYI